MNLIKKGNRVLQQFGIDPAVRNTLLGRGWFALSGMLSLTLLTHFLTRTEQGYYFTFSSIIALQVFFELGLSSVILQFSSHERAHLYLDNEGKLQGDPIHKSRLASLLRDSLKWYLVCATLLIITLIPGGYWFFLTHTASSASVVWKLPWCWIVVMTAGWLAITPLLALIEGCGFVKEVAGLQLSYSLYGSLLFWLALIAHWKLYTAPITNTVSLLYGLFWLIKKYKPLIIDLLTTPIIQNNGVIHWKKEVWPFQWKIALSWGSGYFVFSTFTPILFAQRGAISAGRMGSSLTVMSAVSAISLAWVSTKAAPFGNLVALKKWKELDRIFFPCLLQSTLVLAGLCCAVYSGVILLHLYHLPLASRILPLAPLAFLLLTTLINQPLFAAAVYLRAHKQEPFLWISLVNGICVTVSTFIFAHIYGSLGVMIGYFIINSICTLYGLKLFTKLRSKWHTDPNPQNIDSIAINNHQEAING